MTRALSLALELAHTKGRLDAFVEVRKGIDVMRQRFARRVASEHDNPVVDECIVVALDALIASCDEVIANEKAKL